ncbi:unnamed protein product [Soboliphyme baturini]|uniref:Ras-associating domain-containing protein n=1 Tax=Soboliphyme baturini TaxID=241478 RepID=A0A183J0B0_9BILA|nr:unnamed protein product [Soboliphyme baturini]
MATIRNSTDNRLVGIRDEKPPSGKQTQTFLAVFIYDNRTLVKEETLNRLKEESSRMTCDILGLYETQPRKEMNGIWKDCSGKTDLDRKWKGGEEGTGRIRFAFSKS